MKDLPLDPAMNSFIDYSPAGYYGLNGHHGTAVYRMEGLG
jgi:hypothetical protein